MRAAPVCLIPWRGLSRVFFVHLIAVEMRSRIVTHQAMCLNSIMLSVGNKAVAGYHELCAICFATARSLSAIYTICDPFSKGLAGLCATIRVSAENAAIED
jgi:hypothetical protein